MPFLINDRYLDSEERAEVVSVKVAERRHLVCYEACVGEDREEEKKEDDRPDLHNDECPPLTDGCDLPGWRRERIAPCMEFQNEDVSQSFGGSLNIGASSELLRRESQFPFSSAMYVRRGSKCWWNSAKEGIFGVPPRSERRAPEMEHHLAAKLVQMDCNGKRREATVFCKEYEIKNRPVKILGATQGWVAMPSYQKEGETELSATQDNRQDSTEPSWVDVGCDSRLFSAGGSGGWTFANLLERFGNITFRFSDTHGEMMSLETYSKYITSPEGLSDDSPLGIYDSQFGDDEPTSVLLEEYSVPKCFSPDLFECVTAVDDKESSDDNSTQSSTSSNVGESRPPFRWVLIGPERSGTGMHVDPLYTNAWVTVLQGRKRWLLFPPDTPFETIGMIEGRPQIPSSIWFRDYYELVTSTSWPKQYRPVEVLQLPGETVFVPAGWPHLVLNLELCVAITHNYASEFGPHYSRMLEDVSTTEPEFAWRWHRGLRACGREDLIPCD
mmetsp:Transcript_1397/g.3314  ORF Transcript_1397/g.3314 Transcript_1397/m.3314 type:complete len:499 (-) Transcript_1397:316-1812(-)